MKAVYEAPLIRRLQPRGLNKFGRRATPGPGVRSEIDGARVADLVERFGSPLFVFSERTLRRRYRRYYQAFATRYPDVVFGWSYKTNYLNAVCGIMHQEGAAAEVVSAMEYEKARALGIPGERIIFNGPHKPIDFIERAIVEGARINVDHLDELADVVAVAERLNRTVEVGLRVNLDSGIAPQWSRFGFNLESGQALEAVRRMSQAGCVRFVGLHCHLGTYILDPAAYGRAVEKLLAFAYDVEDRFGFRITSLDLGGGFPSQNKLKGTYLAADLAAPSIDEYAEALCDALERNLRRGHRPTLVLESGRALVDEAGFLITSVVASKRLADDTRAYVVDAGINVLYTAFWYDFRVETDRPHGGLTEPSVVYGPLCMNIDVVAERLDLPPLRRGEHLIVSPVGAYNVTQSMQFIEYRPAIVLVAESGEVELIREREQLCDVDRREQMPPRLLPDADRRSLPNVNRMIS